MYIVNLAGRKTHRRRGVAFRAARYFYKFVTDSHHRNYALLRIFKPHNLFQPDNHTGTDRYPDLFAFARDTLGRDARHLLSFGCSTGEEVFTLRRYFPEAAITGIDINPTNIAAARSRLVRTPNPEIAFDVGLSTISHAPESYDAIFCLSVLRHGGLRAPGTIRCDHLVRFSDFWDTVADFARCLKPGGLLFIVNSNFRFGDTDVSNAFEVVFDKSEPGHDHRTPIFGPDNKLIVGAGYDPCGFRKQS